MLTPLVVPLPSRFEKNFLQSFSFSFCELVVKWTLSVFSLFSLSSSCAQWDISSLRGICPSEYCNSLWIAQSVGEKSNPSAQSTHLLIFTGTCNPSFSRLHRIYGKMPLGNNLNHKHIVSYIHLKSIRSIRSTGWWRITSHECSLLVSISLCFRLLPKDF